MNISATDLSAIIGALVLLVTAIATYLNSRSTVKQVAELHDKVDAVATAVNAPAPLIDGHAIPPADSLSATTPLPPRG